jgi:hypothetical protein
MAESDFSFSGEVVRLPSGRVIVRGTRTSSGGRDKKHVFIEVECPPEDAPAVQQALSIILQRHGRINASAF